MKHLSSPRLGKVALPVLLVVVVLCRLLPHSEGRLVGDVTGDLLDSVWGYWWFAGESSAGRLLPYHTPLLFYPDGGALMLPDPLNGWLAWVLGAADGPVRAYNLLIGVHVILAGVGAFALALASGAIRGSAVIVAAAVMTSSHLLALIEEGVPSATGFGWIAVSLALLIRSQAAASPTMAVAAGTTAALTLFAGHYHAFQLVILAGIICGTQAVRASAPRRNFRLLALSAFTAVILTAPVQFIYLHAMRDGTELRLASRLENHLEPFDVTGLEYFVPFHDTAAPVPRPPYIGLAFCALALIGATVERRMWRWWAAALSLLILSMGPALYWRSALVMDLPMPYDLMALIPPLSFFRNAFRFQAGAMLALVPPCAAGIGAMHRKHLPLAVLFFLLIGDHFVCGRGLPKTSSAEHPPACDWIAEQPDRTAVLDLPVRFRFHRVGWYEFYQTRHHRPIPYNISEASDMKGFNPRLALEVPLILAVTAADPHFTSPAGSGSYRMEEWLRERITESEPTMTVEGSAVALQRLGIGYVVLHEEWLEPVTAIKMSAILAGELRRVPGFQAPSLWLVPYSR
ncbi:hypothetical protein JW905_10490 [bacterium]|nr:hypothetical protein [candidate division CSSED10-310 bacterium]